MNNVLHLNSNYADAFYAELFASIKERGISNIVFVPQKIGFDDCPNATGVIKSACYSKFDRFFLKKKTKKIFKAIEEKVDLKTMDLIHAHSLYTCGVPAYYCFLKYKIPYIVSVRYNDVTAFPKYNPISKKLIIDVLKHAKSIVFITPLIKEIATKKFRILREKEIDKKCHIIPNKISNCFLEGATPKSFDSHKEGLNLLFVGRLVKNKRLELLCKYCQKYFSKSDKLTVITASKGQPTKLIKKYKFIDFIGNVKHNDLVPYYKNSDVFVLLSKNETFGISYIESMSQGTPIVLAKKQAIDGMFEQGKVGYSINAHSYKDFKEKIEIILANYSTISKNCISLSKEFSSDIITDKLVSLYLK